MNKDQVEGRLDQAKGKIKELAGKVVDNDRLEAEGKADQISGKVQAKLGDTKETVKDKAWSRVYGRRHHRTLHLTVLISHRSLTEAFHPTGAYVTNENTLICVLLCFSQGSASNQGH